MEITTKTPINACGMMHRSGYENAETFADKCGVNPLQFPTYFKIGEQGYVIIKQAFANYCRNYFNKVENNWKSIGINNK